ncbi:MAG TPA: type II toxin-antitoxin system VapB family antitoxin [Reyranella sp.]|nr:type II toxin-antitoxin system VapB family antitoxin [Reyranella sp.]
MGVSIKSLEAERKLRRVSRLLGKSMTATVIELADGKLKEIDARQGGKRERERILRSVDRIVRRVKALPVLRKGTDDELLGYNKHGLFD